MYIDQNLYVKFRAALCALAYSGKLHHAYALKGYLASIDTAPYFGAASEGATVIVRLLNVANHRAYITRYPHAKGDAVFEKLPKHFPAVTPTNHRIEVDFQLILATLKSLHFAIYQCEEDGAKLKCSDRGYWKHFVELDKILTTMLVENAPGYQQANWGEPQLNFERLL
jgi:hypothetical protein